jgi:hypothetical protein
MSAQAKSMKSDASNWSAPSSVPDNTTYADKKKNALSAKNTAVLSYDELERIKNMCS